MKTTAIWSGTPGAAMHPIYFWHRIMQLVSGAIDRDKSAELTRLRTQITALERENLQLKCHLAAAPTELARLAYTDCLTGLPNRRALHCAAAREMARIHRTARPVCVVLVDIDHFKAINDDFGHAQGDAVLRLLAATLKVHIRRTDTLARWGGEEFALLLPETDLPAAQIVAEKCRLAVQVLTNLPRPITITLGVSELCASDGFDAALARADCALYKGKAGGRNRVEI